MCSYMIKICIMKKKWNYEKHVFQPEIIDTAAFTFKVVRDSSAVRRLFFDLLEPWDVRELYIRKTADLSLQLCIDTFPRFNGVSWLSDFIFYLKPLYKSLHQSFFYSFITILLSESGVYTPLQHDFALDYHFAMLTFIFEPTNVISRY